MKTCLEKTVGQTCKVATENWFSAFTIAPHKHWIPYEFTKCIGDTERVNLYVQITDHPFLSGHFCFDIQA